MKKLLEDYIKLLEDALQACKTLVKHPEVTLHGDEWVSFPTWSTCSVCLAGAYFALKAYSEDDFIEKVSNFSPDVTGKILDLARHKSPEADLSEILDLFRSGRINTSFNMFRLYKTKKYLSDRHSNRIRNIGIPFPPPMEKTTEYLQWHENAIKSLKELLKEYA